MPILVCADVVEDDGCKYTAHESSVEAVEDDMITHIKEYHPHWYNRLTEWRQIRMRLSMMGHVQISMGVY